MDEPSASLYIDKKLSLRQIAKEVGFSKSKVYQKLVDLGVPMRKHWGGCHGSARKVGSKFISHGYVFTILPIGDFFSSMARRGTGHILEHRLVMARYMGRNLHSWEIVHHKNHIKDDNRIENLQLVSDDRHKQITLMERKISQLEKEVRLLKWQISELNKREVKLNDHIGQT